MLITGNHFYFEALIYKYNYFQQIPFVVNCMDFAACVDKVRRQKVWECACVMWLNTAWLAQLGECWSAEWKVVSSNPGQTNTRGLKITEEKVLSL